MTIKNDNYFHQIKLLANVLIKKDEKYIVIEKKFNKKIDAPQMVHALGGHIDHGENPLEAARREILEESGIQIKNIRLKAIITEIKETAEPAPDWTIFHFIADYDSGKITESAEGKLLILSQKELLKKPMLESFRYIINHLLSEGNKIMFANFYYQDGKFIANKNNIYLSPQ